MRFPLRRKGKRVAKITEDSGAADEQPAVGDPAGTLADLEKKVNKLQQDLTGRINKINTDLTKTVGEIDVKVGTANNAVNNLKSKVENNEQSISSFQGTLDDHTQDIGKLQSADTVMDKRVGSIEKAQSSINTMLIDLNQKTKDFAVQIGQEANKHTDDVAQHLQGEISNAVAPLDQKITALENAPVKPHTHTVTIQGKTGGVAPEDAPQGAGKR